MKAGQILRRVRVKVRNSVGDAVLHARVGRLDPGSPETGVWMGFGHYPSKPISEHRPGHEFPSWMDAREPWIASLRDLYALPVSWPASLSPQAGLLLHALVLNAAPRVALETGTFIGISAHWTAAALRSLGGGPKLHCFDTFDAVEWIAPGFLAQAGVSSQRDFVARHLDRAGLREFVTLHPGDSSAEIRRMHGELASAGGVDFAFIDGDHTEAGAARDLAAVEPVLNTGASIVLHDIYPDQCGHLGPRFIIEKIREIAAGRYQLCELYTGPLNYGMAVLRRVG